MNLSLWISLCVFSNALGQTFVSQAPVFNSAFRPNFRVTNLPDFVGFSYSRASHTPPSPRFIHFLQENLNVNGNFLPTYGSFEATRAGVYYFTYSFLSENDDATIVALRINGKTIVSSISEDNGHNPVTQSTLAHLQEGDTVQLEVLRGHVYETNTAEFAYTTFTGWLVASPNEGGVRSDKVPPRRRHDQDQCCCRICDDHPRPPYRPPPPRTTRPPYIFTTTTLSPPIPTYPPPPSTSRPPFGRVPDHCCDSLLVSSSSARTRDIQREKFGIYRLIYVDRSDGRAVFKHCEENMYIYYFDEAPSGWKGWIVGPTVGVGRGGLVVESDVMCVEDELSGRWKFYDKSIFLTDSSVEVNCFSDDHSGHSHSGRDLDSDVEHHHYHRHEHFHHDKEGHHEPRSLQPPGPAYNVHSNPDFVEATFVFPNRQDVNGSNTYDPLNPQIVALADNLASSVISDEDSTPEVIEAVRTDVNDQVDRDVNGRVLRHVQDDEE